MRKLLPFLFVLFSTVAFSQAPSLINYQGAARDAAGAPVVNTSISVRFEFLQGSSLATVFTETQTIVTNSLGLFSTQIGKNTSNGVSGVNFDAGALQLRVAVDMSGGTNFVTVGTQSLVSVPFAFYSSDVPTTYTNNILTIGKTSYTLNGSGAVYTAGNGISIINNTITNTAPDQTVAISSGNSNVAVTGTYPNFTVASSPSLSLVAPGTLSITNGNTVSIDPSLSFSNGILTVGSTSNVVSIGSAPVPTVQGGGAVSVSTLSAYNYSITAPATSITPGTNVSVTGTFPNYTVASTPSLSTANGSISISGGNSVVISPSLGINGNTLTIGPASNTIALPVQAAQTLSLSANTLSISNGNSVTIAPTLGYNNGTLSVGPATNIISIPVTPNTSLTGSGGGITVTPAGTNTFALSVPATSIAPGTNVTVAGSHPSYTINAAPTLTLIGNNLSISGGNTIPLPSNTIVAVTTTVSGGGAINVTTVSASNYSVSYTPSLTMLSQNTMSIVGGNSVVISPSLGLVGNVLSVGPSGNTITLPATSSQSLIVVPNGSLSITGGNTVNITPTLGLVGNVLNVGPTSNSITIPTQTAQTLTYTNNLLGISNGNSVTIAPILGLTGSTLQVGPASNTISLPGLTAQSLSTLAPGSLSITGGNSVSIIQALAYANGTLAVGPLSNTVSIPSQTAQTLTYTNNLLGISNGNSVTIAPNLAINGTTLQVGPPSNTLIVPGLAAQTLTYSANTLSISNGNAVVITPSLAYGNGTLAVGPLSNTIGIPSQTAQVLSLLGANTLSITNGGSVAIAPNLAVNGTTLQVGPPSNTLIVPGLAAQTLTYSANTLSISNGNAVVITPSLAYGNGTLAVGPLSNTIGIPSQTAQTLNYAANTLSISNGNAVVITPSLAYGNGTLAVGPLSNTIGIPSQTAQVLSLLGANTLSITNGGSVAIAPNLAVNGTTLQVGPPSNTLIVPGLAAQTLTYSANTLSISNGNAVVITPSLAYGNGTLAVGPLSNTIGIPSQTAQVLSLLGANTLSITNGGSVAIAPNLAVNGTTLQVGPPSNTLIVPGLAAQTLTYSANTLSISNGNAVVITPSLAYGNGTLAVGPLSNTIGIPSQTAQVLSLLGANTLSISNGGSVAIAPNLAVNGTTLQVGPPSNTLIVPGLAAQTLSLTAPNTLSISGGNTITIPSPNIVGSGAVNITTTSINNYSISVPQTVLNQGNNVSILGSFPSYTIASTPSLVLTGQTLSITNSNTVAIPVPTISPAGMASVVASGNSFTVGVPLWTYDNSTGNIISGASTLNILPTLTITGGTITSGPASNSVAIQGLLNGGTANYVPKWNGTNALTSTSNIFDDGTNVGIGTTAPSQKLDVTGYIRMGSGAGTANEAWLLASPGAGTAVLQAGGRASADARIVQSNNAPLSFYTNNTEKMRITGSGNVGINNAAPSVALDVFGQTQFITNAVTTTYASIIENNTASATSSGVLRLTNTGVRTVGNSGALIQNFVTKSGGSNSIKTGLEVISTGAWGTGGLGGHINRALYVEATGGVDGNYAAVFMGGNVGINDLTPDATLNVEGTFDAGTSNTVTGVFTSGIGGLNTVSNQYNSAIGYSNTLSGVIGLAFGSSNTVTANRAIAIGSFLEAQDLGSMLIGDYANASAANVMSSSATNQLSARFAGGYRFFTNFVQTPSLSVNFAPNGNVGIGNSAPNAPLQFTNTITNRKIVMYETANNDHQYYGFGINGGALRYQTDAAAADHVFYSAINATSSTELMRVKGNGNVGIGTSVPGTSRLNLTIPSTDATNPIGLTINNNYTGTVDKFGIDVNVDGAGSGNKYGISSSVIGLAADASAIYGYQVAMTPNGSGPSYGIWANSTNVGTGTRHSLYASSVMNSSNTATGYGIYNFIQKQTGSTGILYGYQSITFNDGSGASYGLYSSNGGYTTAQRFGLYITGETDNYISNNLGLGVTNPGYRLELSTNSAAKPTSNVWTVSSDARLKKDVHNYEAGLKEILQIRPVWFTYTGEAEMPQETGVGVIAQELQKIAPYMVREWTYIPSGDMAKKTGNRDAEPADFSSEAKQYLGVDNGAMTYMIINAIKEQQQQIEELKKLIEAQQKLIDELNKK